MDTVEAVLWDFDGVIIDSEPLHCDAWREALAPFGVEISQDEFLRRFVGVEDRDVIRDIAAEQTPARDFDELWSAFPRKQELFLATVMAAPHVPLETRTLLLELRDRGLHLGLVTSSSATEVVPVLELNGIRDAFDVCVFAESVQNKKPHPEPYLMAKRNLGVEHALVVEDSAAGMKSGRDAGCEVLQVISVADVANAVRRRLGLRGEGGGVAAADR